MIDTIKNWLSCNIILVLALCMSIGNASAQGWKPANEGLNAFQFGGFAAATVLNFKTDLSGREWMYGGYLDEDSLRRNVAYREGGKWVPLPFSGYHGNIANDIEMYGDTLYILGGFQNLVKDSSGDLLPTTGLIKWFNDSLWTANDKIDFSKLSISAFHMSSKGDSMLIAGGDYYDSVKLIGNQFMSSDGGQSWQYPYSVIHPTEAKGNFSATYYKAEILPNGDIITLNNASPLGSTFRGLSRWDGHQWHGYGNGLSGSTSRAFDFEFYKGQLYMGGTFWKSVFPNDPGDFIVRWNGQQWEEFANGMDGFTIDLFADDSTLFCQQSVSRFGDVNIPYFAGWDGHQWCGTPSQFKRPPAHFGFINDTLYVSFLEPSAIDGDSVGYMAYYDGDYLHGADAICSTFGLGEQEKIATKPLVIYPNPVKDWFTLSPESEHPLKQLELYDLYGKCVMDRKYFSLTEDVLVSMEHLPSGIYMVMINGKHGQKLVKM